MEQEHSEVGGSPLAPRRLAVPPGGQAERQRERWEAGAVVVARQDFPERGELPVRSAFLWPRCTCGSPQCPDTAGAADDDWSQSPTMQRIRPLIEAENDRSRGGRP